MADENKGSFFGKFADAAKGLIFEESASPAAPAGPPAQQAAPPAGATPAFVPTVAYTAPNYGNFGQPAPAAIDPKFQERFKQMVEAANIQGNDYFEFRRTLDNFNAMPVPMPDNAKYPAAFFALGVTVQLIKDSAAHYIGILDADAAEFAQAQKQRTDEKVNGHIQTAQKLQAETDAMEQQINEIRARQAANAAAIQQAQQLAQEEQMKIEQKAASYNVTRAAYISSIQADLQALDTYVAPMVAAAQPKP